jgi:hypothetical protein
MNTDEVLFNIMINNDINLIKNICITSKNALHLCSDIYFWQKKFEHDNLPIMSKILPKYVSEWIIEYNCVFKSHTESRHIVIVNNIESTRLLDQTDGVILLSLPRGVNPRHLLPEKYGNLLVRVVIYARDNNMIPFTQYIKLIRINNNYKFTYYLRESIGVRLVKSPDIDCTDEDIINILIQISYHNKFYNDSSYINITDSEKIPFTGNFLYDNDNKTIVDKRISILDTLKFKGL